MKRILLLLTFPLLGILFCSPFPAAGQPEINRTDAGGLKQGAWEKRYPNGKLMYQGTFKDDKPTGEWKRWNEKGTVTAILRYSETGDTVWAKLYEGLSNPVAEGIYLGTKKEGSWRYFKRGTVIALEEFSGGMKNGTCRKFYPSGELLEEAEWQDDRMHGKYAAYFTSGKAFLECHYVYGQRDGTCLGYYPSGAVEVKSPYEKDLPEGMWTYYDEEGNIRYTLRYRSGILQNPEVLRELDSRQLEELEKQRDRILDPEKYLEDPEGFLERKR